MVVGGEVVTLKSIEESTGIVMQEMPMQVSLLVNSYHICLTMSGSHGIHPSLNWLNFILMYESMSEYVFRPRKLILYIITQVSAGCPLLHLKLSIS